MKNLIFTFTVIVLLAGLLHSSLAQASTNEITWEEFVSRLTPEQQAEVWHHTIEAAAKRGMVANVTNVWEILTNAQLIATCAIESKEPLREDLLDALERSFRDVPDARQQFRAATILYRYSRSAGREYLIQRLNSDTNDLAATILVMNQELEVLPAIFDVFRRQVRANDPPYGILKEILRWRPPSAASVVLEAFKLRAGNGEYAIAAAKLGASDAAPLIQQMYDRLPEYAQCHRFDFADKVEYAGSLARLGVNADHHVSTLTALLNADRSLFDPDAYDEHAIVRALGIAATPKAIESLRTVVGAFLQNQQSANVTVSVELAIDAAIALVDANSPSGVQALTDLLRRGADRTTVANALILAAGMSAEPVLREHMGEEWWRHVLATKDLKRLPKYFPPGQNWAVGDHFRSELPF